MTESAIKTANWRNYYDLCKPKVVALLLLTAIVGVVLASPPWQIPLFTLVVSTVGIGLAAAAGAVINQVVERENDARMARTEGRPLPQGKVTQQNAFIFAVMLAAASVFILTAWINVLTAALTFASMIGYAVVYTMYLKKATPQNIVIGGLAGATPPLLGWTSVTNSVDPHGLLLVLIIYTWTPPHFWALAIHRRDDYAKVNLPMLPVTHGIEFTKYAILGYTILMVLVTLLPYLAYMRGLIYLVAALLLGGYFLYMVLRLMFTDHHHLAIKTFVYSINYLMLLFIAMVVDHYLPYYPGY
ncbi:MAG: protoheme IX farnesyltransferase [Gammaproteobacteria bacterium]|nr:heme o synthase [Gammaproteobacteria bacterium]NNJ98556.1 protoheme IX farnesyltransferase [Gammaproteobacteria bacterium]